MKTTLFTLSLILIFGIANCQKNLTVKWGPEIKAKSKTWISRILGHDESYFYVLRVPRRGIKESFWLEKYSKSKLTIMYSKEIELPKIGRKSTDYEFLGMFNDKFLLITSYYNRDKDEKYAFSQTISKNGILSSKFKEIDKISGKKKHTSFGFEISQDESKLLVFRNEEYSKEANERFAYKAYDENMNELWSKNIEVEHSDRYFSIWDYEIDDKGIVYALTKLYRDKYRGQEKLGRKMQQFKYALIIYNPETDETEQFKVDLGPEKFVSEISYALTSDDKLVIVGFYSKKDEYSMDGTFFISIDPNSLDVSARNLKEFDNEFLREFLKEREVRKDKELRHFVFEDILLRDDGGFYIIAEQNYTYISTTTDAEGHTSTTVHYVSNDLIAINIDSEGSILWMKKIPKKQHTANDGGQYLSYAMTWTDEQIHFIFNANPKNEELYRTNPDKMKSMNKPKKSVTTLVSLDATGSSKRSALFKSKDFGTIVQPRLNYAPENSELIIYGEKGSKYKFGKLTFTNFN